MGGTWRLSIGGTDYTVSYGNNKNIGKETLTVKGKGGYSGATGAKRAKTK